jgi:two-component system response regulator RegX3
VSGASPEGFRVEVARDGREALDVFDAVDPDIVLLDLMLPKLGGVDVCREIRSRSGVAIIMVTAKSSEVDTVVGLEVGADDYVTKPYRLRELVARMRSVMRRVDERGADDAGEAGEEDTLEVADVRLDAARHEVFVRGQQVQLPLKEFAVLQMLLQRAGRVVTRDRLIDGAWGDDYVGDTKTLDVHIKRLRGRIESDPTHPERILTVRGVGYKYAVERGR